MAFGFCNFPAAHRDERRHFPFVALDHFFDDENLMGKVHENSATLDFDGKKNMMTYTVDTTGYTPEELQVHIEGDQTVVIRAEHKQATDTETVFPHMRRVRIPDGFLTKSYNFLVSGQLGTKIWELGTKLGIRSKADNWAPKVKCEVDEHGRLWLTAQRKDGAES